MSQLMQQNTPKQAKKRGDWTDLNRDGKRIEALIKQLNTRVNPKGNKNNRPEPLSDELKLAYIQTIIKLTHEKRGIVDTVLQVKELLKEFK